RNHGRQLARCRDRLRRHRSVARDGDRSARPCRSACSRCDLPVQPDDHAAAKVPDPFTSVRTDRRGRRRVRKRRRSQQRRGSIEHVRCRHRALCRSRRLESRRRANGGQQPAHYGIMDRHQPVAACNRYHRSHLLVRQRCAGVGSARQEHRHVYRQLRSRRCAR
ncbi:hypothetical protein KXV85_003589, partial [Aspergillus fumigatus]